MWLLPIRVQVRIILIVTNWIWKTIMSNIFFSFCSHLTVGQCVYVCAWCSCVGFFSLQKCDKKIFMFLKTLCKYCWWKLAFVVRQVFICHLMKMVIFMNNSGDVDNAEVDYNCPSWKRAFDVHSIFVGGVVGSGQESQREGVIPNTSQVHCSNTATFLYPLHSQEIQKAKL